MGGPWNNGGREAACILKGRKGYVGPFDFHSEGHKDVQLTDYGREGEAWFLHKRGSSVICRENKEERRLCEAEVHSRSIMGNGVVHEGEPAEEAGWGKKVECLGGRKPSWRGLGGSCETAPQISP